MPSLLGAVTGGITGALAAAALTLATASTKAEREERGRKRVDARRDVLRALNEFDGAVRSYRQKRYRHEPVDENELETAAVKMAGEARQAAVVLPVVERRRLLRRVRKLLGPGYWRESELRPHGAYARVQTDPVALAAVADTRPHSVKSKMSPELLHARPADPRWDQLVQALASLRKLL